jgi:hypothetical protein
VPRRTSPGRGGACRACACEMSEAAPGAAVQGNPAARDQCHARRGTNRRQTAARPTPPAQKPHPPRRSVQSRLAKDRPGVAEWRRRGSGTARRLGGLGEHGGGATVKEHVSGEGMRSLLLRAVVPCVDVVRLNPSPAVAAARVVKVPELVREQRQPASRRIAGVLQDDDASAVAAEACAVECAGIGLLANPGSRRLRQLRYRPDTLGSSIRNGDVRWLVLWRHSEGDPDLIEAHYIGPAPGEQ